jgi:hypothetical protein
MDTSINPAQAAEQAERMRLLLRSSEPSIEGLFPVGSNTTLLCNMRHAGGCFQAVYKPSNGERPLWDFPAGTLGMREAAAFEVCRALGWNYVPPTVFREDGPLGAGSYQEYLPLDLESNYFTLRAERSAELGEVAALDVLINNADRKALHVLGDSSGGIHLIDHGICFHAEYKLRTVIWDFAGQPIPGSILEAVRGLRRQLSESGAVQQSLRMLLAPEEIVALEARASLLEQTGIFPEPGPGWNVPYPIWA